MTNKFGLQDRDITHIINTFTKFSNIEKVIIFGSRAMGNNKKGSDIDLALFGQIDHNMILKLYDILNEQKPIPFFFDLVIYDKIENKELKRHIDKEGKILYLKGSTVTNN